MTRHIRAHFDGKVIVPDQPVELPVNQPLDVHLAPASGGEIVDPRPIEERRAALKEMTGCVSVPPPSRESLRREYLYDDTLP